VYVTCQRLVFMRIRTSIQEPSALAILHLVNDSTCINNRIYTVNHKKRDILFLTINVAIIIIIQDNSPPDIPQTLPRERRPRKIFPKQTRDISPHNSPICQLSITAHGLVVISVPDSAGASLHEPPNYNNWPSIFWRPF